MSRFSLFLLGMLAISSGCSAHLVAAPTRPTEDAGFTVEAIPEPEGMAPAPALPFRLQPGDILSLRTISLAPLEVPRLSVDDAGFLHAPLTGAIAVAGASLEEAEALLQERLRRYDRFGIVSLTVAEPAGHRVSVLGAVARSGTYILGSPTRVADLLAMAGGVQRAEGEAETVELGDLEAARLLRAGEPLPISIPRALAGDPRHNVLLAPRDVLFVPALQGAAVRVLGEVKHPRLIPWRPGLRLSEVLAQAQGMSADADEADVRVVRGPLSAPRLYRASLRALIQGSATDVELARGDIVFVTKHWFASATDVLQRLVPLLVVSPVPR
ncbi:SLBB domain-containing protein [Hyalangium sp.]|uniref:SLBB domain-containing protein n=1 Tax=Hyalangium sp. TaxID=2028555 RepID=UPI002D26B610|nr:SLBB domain-containing protein [Hyalangium sp.]HYI01098.1 SLBB domain-containing protein [Hyalangium sp.]